MQWILTLLTAVLLVVTAMINGAMAQVGTQTKTESEIYQQFYNYRTSLNQRISIEQLANYFSQAFNQYYQTRLKAKNRQRNNEYLNQYWDNLNWGKEIVVVTNYSIKKLSADHAQLLLEYISDAPYNQLLEKVVFKQVVLDYVKEAHGWRINAYEFNFLNPYLGDFDPEKTVDNFVELK